MIEWCASSTFNDPNTFGTATVLVSDAALVLMEAGGNRYAYEVSGLTTGKSYWLRVSAKNSIGTGSATLASASLAIATKPSAPVSASLTSASVQSTPITSASLAWTPPATNGGSPITGYVVEWWEAGSIPEKQIISFTAPYPEFDASLPAIAASEYKFFNLAYGPEPGTVESTANLPFQIHPANIRSVLMNIGRDTGATSFNDKNIIGDVRVSKSNIINSGVAWTVTFNSLTNAGDLPSLGASVDACSSCSTAITVTELQSGQREFGTPEVQILTILHHTSTDASDLGGFFRDRKSVV